MISSTSPQKIAVKFLPLVSLLTAFSILALPVNAVSSNKPTINGFGVYAHNKDNAKLTNSDIIGRHQCTKTFNYDIYFLRQKVGYLQRTIKWKASEKAVEKIEKKENNNQVSAKVTSHSNVDFLWLNSTYQQTTSLQYSPDDNYFLTQEFSQKLTGLEKREMVVKLSTDGLSSTVTLDNEISHYTNLSKPLHDIDTLGIQMRFELLQNKKSFTLFRQGSDEINEYKFEVLGIEVIKHNKWGELTTIKVIEVGEHKGTVLWFSIDNDYQLVKAKLNYLFSPVVWLTNFKVECN